MGGIANELIVLIPALLLAGAVTGILAGIFGIGGGAIIVPALYELFRVLGVPYENNMPLCVGTSLAIIIPTAIRSFLAHRKTGQVDEDLLRRWAIPVVAGVLVGAAVARVAPPEFFKGVFIFVASVIATKLLFGRDDWRIAQEFPGGFLTRLYGAIVGFLSSLVGIGGGGIATMFMTLHGRAIRQAVATSSGLGVLISIPGALGFMVAGWPFMDRLPPFSIGYVSLIGALLFVPTSLACAPIGVRLAHSLPKRTLEIGFGCFLVFVALRFAWSLVFPS